jgi:uncharacterized protein (AIM24 family)
MSGHVCPYCRLRYPRGPSACPHCGASAARAVQISDSGWVRQPPIADMARLQLGSSTCQIVGTVVPIAEFDLANGDTIYFPERVLLWVDPSVELSIKALAHPAVLLRARGPGRIALSDNHAGEMVALPMERGEQVWAHRHRFVCASGNVARGWSGRAKPGFVSGQHPEIFDPAEHRSDVFTAEREPGLVLLHAPGSTFIRDLGFGGSLLVQPDSLLYRDHTVRATLHLEYQRLDASRGMARGQLNARYLLARLTGPGRVAVQSVYEVPPDDGQPMTARTQTGASVRDWSLNWPVDRDQSGGGPVQ